MENNSRTFLGTCTRSIVVYDKVRMYEEMMTNDDNLESNPLTSSLLKIRSLQWRIQDFPLGGCQPIGGHQPLTCTLFGKNVCENERNGSCWGCTLAASPGSANGLYKFYVEFCYKLHMLSRTSV